MTIVISDAGYLYHNSLRIVWDAGLGRWIPADLHRGWDGTLSSGPREGSSFVGRLPLRQDGTTWVQPFVGHCTLCGWTSTDYMTHYPAQRAVERHRGTARHDRARA